MGDLFDGYGSTTTPRTTSTGISPWDEMFGAPDAPGGPVRSREAYRELHQALAQMTQEELRGRTDSLASSYLAQGVTFDFAGEERPFPIDAVPRVIDYDEWATTEAGVKQRVRALEAFLDDAYGRQHCVRDGVLPAPLIASSQYFYRQAAGIHSANGVRIQVSGIDLIRDEHGEMRVLEDNVRVPSGVSYVISNRRMMAQTLPELFVSMQVRPVGDYPVKLLHALKAAAPPGVTDPNVVVMTPGVYNSAYFEHTLLARLMGVELVEGRDLLCTGGKVFMRTTSGPRRVDVIYRRIDDDFIDPVQFRADSMLGAPGLLLAARLGNVTIANAVGNGVADDKLLYTYVPDLIRYYLSEEPILKNVDTWRLEDPGALEEVLDRLDELVVKPVDGSGGKGIVVGPDATPPELDRLRTRLIADPRGWIAQPVVMLSTIPTLVEDGVRPRHADLRPFAVNDGDDIWVLPGGLTRVALPEGQLVVNSSQGGGSKDTWVVGGPATGLVEYSQGHGLATLVADQASITEAIPVITHEMLEEEARRLEEDGPPAADDADADGDAEPEPEPAPAQGPQGQPRSRQEQQTQQQQQGSDDAGGGESAPHQGVHPPEPGGRRRLDAPAEGGAAC